MKTVVTEMYMLRFFLISDLRFASDNPEFALVSSSSCPLSGTHPSGDTTTRAPWHITEHLLSPSTCSWSDWVFCPVHLWPRLYHGFDLNIVWGDVLYVSVMYGYVGFLYKRCTHTFNSVNVNNKNRSSGMMNVFQWFK